jgi:hypothetical protein
MLHMINLKTIFIIGLAIAVAMVAVIRAQDRKSNSQDAKATPSTPKTPPKPEIATIFGGTDSGSVPTSVTNTPTVHLGRINWEYKIVTAPEGNTSALNTQINALGNEGYELVNFTTTHSNDVSSNKALIWVAVLKRPQ